jgi:hypothetical protein
VNPTINRREFTRTSALSVAAAALPTSLLAAKKVKIKKSKIKVGHTGITRSNSEMVPAIADVSYGGFYVLKPLANPSPRGKKNRLSAVLQTLNPPLNSAYCNLTEPSLHKVQGARPFAGRVS